MTTVVIKDTNAQAKGLIEYIRTLPFVEIVDEPSKKLLQRKRKIASVLSNGSVN